MEKRYRRKIDVFRDLQKKILPLIDVHEDRSDIIRSLLGAIKKSCGSDGVGIRFRDIDDFPYAHRSGSPEGFLLMDDFADSGPRIMRICRDDTGNASLECVCGRVISGDTDTAGPDFTPNGSFWTNNAPALKNSPENQTLGNFSLNGCAWQGFGSIAMTPIRAKDRIVGLLQFGYREKEYFTLETVELLESIGTGIGELLLRKEMEKRLVLIKESIDNAPDSAYWMDMEGNFIYVNDSGCSALGYSRNELLQMSLFDIAPDITERQLVEIRNILGVHKKLATEVVFRPGNGPEFPVELTLNHVVYDEEEYLSGFARNLTEQKTAEQRLRKSEALFRATFEQAAVGIAHVAVDGRFLLVNRKFCDIVGYTQAEMMRRTFLDITHSDHLKSDAEHLRKLVHGEIDILTTEKKYIHKDGHPVWVSLTSSSIRNIGREPDYFVAVVKDITDRKRIEGELKKSAARLAEAEEISGCGSWSWDIESDRIEWSKGLYRLVGLDPRENILPYYNGHSSIFTPESWKILDEAVHKAIRHGEDYELELNMIHTDGRVIDTLTRGFSIRNDAGRVIRLQGSVLDITAAKQAEIERVQLRNELAYLSRIMTMTELSGSLAHEINQPLGAIVNNASAARAINAKSGDGSVEIGEILDDIVADATRAGEIIRRIRALLGKEEARFEKLDINALIRDVVELYRNTLITEKISVSLLLQPDLSPVDGDPVHLQQLLINLVANATEAMKQCPSKNLSIHSALQSPDTVTVSVNDSGPGVSAETRHMIFEPFFTTKQDGLGMGLRICRSIIEAHGGRIRLEERPAGGATFSFSLKAFKEDFT